MSNSSVNARKRNHYSALQRDTRFQDGTKINIEASGEDVEHNDKRSRQAEWPSQGTSDVRNVSNIVLESSKSSSMSPRAKRNAKLHLHPSKFIEASMHDRVSERPPSLYTAEELAMERYLADQADPHRRDSKSSDVRYDAGIESVKPSGMYRFGKALANAFNPVVMWQGLNGIWKEKSDGQVDLDYIAFQGRRTIAEKAYAELKHEGFRGTQRPSTLRHSMDVPSIKYEGDIDDTQHDSRRGSVVNVDGSQRSAEHERDAILLGSDQSLMPPPLSKGSGRSPSPLSSDASSNRRSSFHLQTPLSSLKKVRSHFQLPSAGRYRASPAPTPSIESQLSDTAWDEKVLRREPSKKDLQKQQKLSKKVSDLEGQLEVARRELWLAKNEIPPVPVLPSRKAPKRFIPGSLPSLPSERLLNDEDGRAHVVKNHEESSEYHDSRSAVVQATTALIEVALGVRPKEDLDTKSKQSRVLAHRKSSFDHPETAVKTPIKSGSKRRHSGGYPNDDATFNPDFKGKDGDGELLPAANSRSSRSAAGQHKSQKLGKGDSPKGSKSSRNSSQNTNRVADENITFQSRGLSFHPENVDKAKLLAMRSNPNSTVEFGQLTDDVINLRKEFPGITNDQLVKYIASLLTGDKKSSNGPKSINRTTTTPIVEKVSTRITSLSHHDQPPLPVLGRPRSVSRDRMSPRKSKSFVSQPSSNLHMTKTDEHLQSSHDLDVGVVMISPSKDKGVPAVPTIPKELDVQTSMGDGELMVEKEEYPWDPDVF